jgi:hypothetical protein
MNTNMTPLVSHLSTLLSEKELKERNLLKTETEAMIRTRTLAVLKDRDEKIQKLDAESDFAIKQIVQMEKQIAADGKELKDLEIRSISCPSPALRDLYSRQAAEIRERIEELKFDIEETKSTAHQLNDQDDAVRTTAQRGLQEILKDPEVDLLKAVNASVRQQIMNWIDVGKYEEAEKAAVMEADSGLLEEVRRQANAKRISVSAAKRMLMNPETLGLPEDTYAVGHMAEVIIAIDRHRQECARLAVSPLGGVYPLRRSNRRWKEEGGVIFNTIKNPLGRNKQPAGMAAAAA